MTAQRELVAFVIWENEYWRGIDDKEDTGT